MKITDVRVRVLVAPLEKPIVTAFGRMNDRNSAIVEVATNEGIVGIGESWINFPHWVADERKATIEKGIKPLLVGEDPRNVSFLWDKMYRCLMGTGRQWGAKALLLQAMSGVDIALWDILGKKLDVPVYQLLGGRVYSEIKAYASGLGPSGYEDIVEKHLQEGFTAFKLKVGFGREQDEFNIKNMRELIGDECILALDANQAWNVDEALENLKAYSKYDIQFIEEPVPADRLSDLNLIKNSKIMPVAGGENLYCREGFKDALCADALNIVQPDITKTGGLSESKIICQMADAWGIPYAPHMFGNAVGVIATLHLFASTPNGLIQEVDANPNPLFNILKEKIRVEDGNFIVPEKPGLGIELDEEAISEFEVMA